MTGRARIYAYIGLYDLADGTVITWERIPGDPTSRAVAILNIEVEHGDHCLDADVSDCACQRVLWISPGGWQPMTLDDAKLTYPLWALGTLDQLTAQGPPPMTQLGEVPVTMLSGEVMSIGGGTYPRDKALECAVLLYQGRPEQFSLDTAVHFEEWLTRETGVPATPDVDPVSYGPDAVTAEQLDMADRLRAALGTLMEASYDYGLPVTDAFRSRVRGLAQTLQDKAERTLRGES